ncbi:aminodeoxychorismate synthase component I [Aquabacter sp. L1I39]|uniref:aminodeoxychorismate synthase component I n=1 Tax=Aquabacter sp. L1I39 TaxID=2820278 RepID=UPI001ADC18FC|nr:aminodeoxychorismate synthase component I [Aquabacter sp. L1I39]QTL02548.1 aminodeoxychorismate synthase component I [Aquabacter sp. L1I39]
MRVVPISYTDPAAAFEAFADEPVAALLQSCAPDGPRGRYSYIAAEPYRLIVATSHGVMVDGEPVPGDPFTVLERELARVPDADGPCPVPFRTGAVGFLGYELGRHLERLPVPRLLGPGQPEMVMGLYDTVIAFDHQEEKAYVISSGAPEVDSGARARRAAMRAHGFLHRLSGVNETPRTPDWTPQSAWQPDLDRTEVEERIARTIAYIRAGDIFQANITQRFTARMPPDLGDRGLYARLRALSPAPFAALLTCGRAMAVASASPERFLSLAADRWVETRPIKGTRPRHLDPAQDATLAAELSASAKDRAENLMIVDLMRNDLGRVAELGSVTVPVLNGLETFASVHHLVSVVRARLREGLGPVDLLRATFPGGSITGAPKIRAMEIIHELEPAPRGVYCGAIAWIGFDGAMDSSIVIRTLVRVGDTVMAQAGGGIVADSDPAAEYEEGMVKIAPLLRAVAGPAPER